MRLHSDRHVPPYDFFETINLDDAGDVEFALENLTSDIESGYFLCWEAVVRQERGQRLTKGQEEALSKLIGFGDVDDRVLYINGIGRPSEPWYDIARKVVSHIPIREPFRTDVSTWGVMHEGWPSLVDALEAHGQDLPLPEGAESPLDVFPVELQHRLWMQSTLSLLGGLGQAEDLTLENEEQRNFRLPWFVDLLKERKDTVQYFDLTLDDLLDRVIMPPKDERIFVEEMIKRLGLTSTQERLADFL